MGVDEAAVEGVALAVQVVIDGEMGGVFWVELAGVDGEEAAGFELCGGVFPVAVFDLGEERGVVATEGEGSGREAMALVVEDLGCEDALIEDVEDALVGGLIAGLETLAGFEEDGDEIIAGAGG